MQAVTYPLISTRQELSLRQEKCAPGSHWGVRCLLSHRCEGKGLNWAFHSVQKVQIMKIKGLEYFIHQWGLRDLGSWIYRRTEGVGSEVGVDVLSQVTRDRMRQNVLKLCQGRLKTDIRRRFFIGRVIKHWNRLPKVVVESPSMEMLRKKKVRKVWLWHLGRGLVVNTEVLA